MKERIKDQQGFTLIEIIISIALVGIITVSLYAGIKFARQTLSASKDYMQSNYLVQAKLEDYLGTRYAEVVKTARTNGVDLLNEDNLLANESRQDLSITWDNTIPEFVVHGFSMDNPSNAFHLNENFKDFVPLTIDPPQ